MIIDLEKFITSERPCWIELEKALEKLAGDPMQKMSLEELSRFHYLYQRTSADLSRISTFASEPEVRGYLESLIARAYGEISVAGNPVWRAFSPLSWLLISLPRAFRRHMKAFALALCITIAGFAFGGLAVNMDTQAKDIIMPFQNLQLSPAERVKREEEVVKDRLKGVKFTGAAWYMTHNIRVCIFTLGLGMTFGIGTILMLFYNGVVLGAVSVEYAMAGKATFLMAWLMPHGALEIPAILLSGQAGLVLAGALIGWGRSIGLRERLRRVSSDLVTLSAGFSLLLVVAGIMESFVSQYHQPVIPYSVKILIGVVELSMLILFFGMSGSGPDDEGKCDEG